MMRIKQIKCGLVFCGLFLWEMTSLSMAFGVPVYIADVPGYGYNSGAYYDASLGYVGCGPTSGVMILDTYDNRGATGLITDSLADAWDMHENYMSTNAAGFGSPSDFHFGIEDFAYDHGYIVDAVVHVEPTTYIPADWSAYAMGDDLAADATFWDTTTWDILVGPFLDFLAAEIDSDRPVSLTVDSDGDGGTDHWLVGVGYDYASGQWAGYNTWDSTLHWYDVESGFLEGNTMGVGFVRTFEFLGAIPDDGDPDDGGPDDGAPVPEPGTMVLFATGLAGFAGYGRKKLFSSH